jgi:FkbM family methyltransferase
LREGAGLVRDRWGFRYALPHQFEPIAFGLLVDRIYEDQLLRCMLRVLRPGSVVIDVGANVGVMTLPLARRVGPKGRVLAIEASPTIFQYLRHNVRLSGLDNIVLEQAAATYETHGPTSFYEAPLTSFGMGSRSPQFGAIATQVKAVTLDQLVEQHGLERVDAVKLDVEGWEAAALRGGKVVLSRTPAPVIFFESCDWALARVPGDEGNPEEVLGRHGYRVTDLGEFVRRVRTAATAEAAGFRTLVARRSGRV